MAAPCRTTYVGRVLQLLQAHKGRTGLSLRGIEKAWVATWPAVPVHRVQLRRRLRAAREAGILVWHHRHTRSYVAVRKAGQQPARKAGGQRRKAKNQPTKKAAGQRRKAGKQPAPPIPPAPAPAPPPLTNVPGGTAVPGVPPAVPSAIKGALVQCRADTQHPLDARFVWQPAGGGGAGRRVMDMAITLQVVEGEDDVGTHHVLRREAVAGYDAAGATTVVASGPPQAMAAHFQQAVALEEARAGTVAIPSQAYVTYGRGLWEYYVGIPVDGKAPGWYPFVAAASATLDRVFGEWKWVAGLSVRHVRSGRWTYRVDFNAMTQTNVVHHNHTVRSVRRVAPPAAP